MRRSGSRKPRLFPLTLGVAPLGALGFLLALSGAAACSSSLAPIPDGVANAADATGNDGANVPDPPTAESGASETGPADAGDDSGHYGDILGTLASGACGAVLENDIASPLPSLETNLLVFVAGETYDRASLSPGGQRLFDTANAGGSSTESEAMSYEVLRYCEGAILLHTETEIAYAPPDDTGPNIISDLSVDIGGKKLGVSVTRAYHPPGTPLTDDDVKALLVKKLEGVNRSSERVLPADKWVKQILHVFSVNQDATDAITRVWPTIDAATKADTIVLVTQTKGGGFVYCHPTPPLGMECQ